MHVLALLLALTVARPRLRDLGVAIGTLPTGTQNAITDVAGVRVGHATLIRGDNIRTGVTAILPHGGNLFQEKVPGAVFVGNGFGKIIGTTQIAALFAGISRDGVAMVSGMFRGLSREDAARFSFLLATPVILAAGLLKIPDLFGPLGDGIHGQVLAGSIASFVAAYLAVRFLTRYFHTRTLMPFAIYCGVAGTASLVWLLVR